VGSEEYLDSEKYQIRVRDWSTPDSLDADIAALNRVRRAEPALQRMDNLTFHESGHPDVLCYLKTAWGRDLLAAVTVDPLDPADAELEVPLAWLGLAEDEPYEVEDLLTGERRRWCGPRQAVRLDPAERVGYLWRVVR
jgi:starch synthase (maltosyl-transferring)